MNIQVLSTSISIQDSPFYKNEVLKPFIDAYLLKPDLVKNDERCQLFGKYKFGDYAIGELTKYPSYAVKHFDMFIGYRFLSRFYRPFFLSMTDHDKDEFEITGFSTIMTDDFNKDYYKSFKKLPEFTNWKFEITVSADVHPAPWLKTKRRDGLADSILVNLVRIAEKTLKRNEVIQKRS